MDIEKYNLISTKNAVKPNYVLTGREKFNFIEFFVDANGRLFTCGNIDNNYACWFSVTDISEMELTEKIIEHIIGSFGNTPPVVTGISEAFPKFWKNMQEMYRCRVQPKDDGNFICSVDGEIIADKSIVGEYCARKLSGLLLRLRYKCGIRECGGDYLPILGKYLRSLKNSDFMKYKYEILPVREILEKEQYLLVSENAEVRRTYIACMERIGNLYNAYMSAVR